MSEKDVGEVFIFNWLSSQPSCTSNSMLCMLCPAPCISTLLRDEATWGRGRAAQGTAAQHTICLSPAPGAALTRWGWATCPCYSYLMFLPSRVSRHYHVLAVAGNHWPRWWWRWIHHNCRSSRCDNIRIYLPPATTRPPASCLVSISRVLGWAGLGWAGLAGLGGTLR